MIPNSNHFLDEYTTNEPAALELGCVVNDIRHVIVCGHSDCKVHTVYLFSSNFVTYVFHGCASKAIKMIFLRDIKNNVYLRVPVCVSHRIKATKINFNAILHIGFWVFSGEFVSELIRFNRFKMAVV